MKLFQKWIVSFCALCLLLTFSACSKETSDTTADPSSGDVIKIEIEMENGGIIKADLYPDIAPITVQNMVDLIEQNFYDGIIFHRCIPGFVIQAGDPTGTGYYGSGTTIKGEFSANGVENNLKHTRGVLSMARTASDMDSASSQFFICLSECTSLNGSYAAFGCVTEGMDVVDEIASQDTDSKDKPLQDQTIKTIRIID